MNLNAAPRDKSSSVCALSTNHGGGAPGLQGRGPPGWRGSVLAAELMHTGLVVADVVVIGVGAIGLSATLHRALLGRSVVVVERFVE
jgi:NADPH-dependent 2,4-dienoyl-CoA reductase/sulfur reductase-like enzyme